MADFRAKKMRNVPIAVTPEGFWCCPAPVAFQKTARNLNPQSKPKSSAPPPPKAETAAAAAADKRPPAPPRSRVASDDQRSLAAESAASSPAVAPVVPETAPKPNSENPQQRKISVGFGQPETSDLKVVLTGKEGIAVRMSVHREVLSEQSVFFAGRLSMKSPASCLEIEDCEDVEIYVETVGLMYCKEVKQRLIRQSVPRVLRVLKFTNSLIGYTAWGELLGNKLLWNLIIERLERGHAGSKCNLLILAGRATHRWQLHGQRWKLVSTNTMDGWMEDWE